MNLHQSLSRGAYFEPDDAHNMIGLGTKTFSQIPNIATLIGQREYENYMIRKGAKDVSELTNQFQANKCEITPAIIKQEEKLVGKHAPTYEETLKFVKAMVRYSGKEIKKSHKSAYPILSKGGKLFDDEDDLKKSISMQNMEVEKKKVENIEQKMKAKAMEALQKKLGENNGNAKEGVILNGVCNTSSILHSSGKEKQLEEFHSEILDNFIDTQIQPLSGARQFFRPNTNPSQNQVSKRKRGRLQDVHKESNKKRKSKSG
jgi:hypothetical protein